jgi:hypothetical protein
MSKRSSKAKTKRSELSGHAQSMPRTAPRQPIRQTRQQSGSDLGAECAL